MLSFLVTLTRFFRAIARAWRDPLFRSTLALTVTLLVSGPPSTRRSNACRRSTRCT